MILRMIDVTCRAENVLGEAKQEVLAAESK